MAGLADLGTRAAWLRELAPTPSRMRTALRTTIACVAATLLAQTFHLEQGFWAIITILVLAPPTAAASVRKATTRLLGTAIGCLIGVGATALFGQQPPLQLAAIFLALAAAIYMATGTIAPYSFFVAGFTTSIVAYAAVQHPEQAGVLAWSRFTEIGLGVLVSGASHLLLWPVHADAELRRALADKLDHAVANLEIVSLRARGAPAPEAASDLRPDERLVAQLDLLDVAAGLHERIHRHRPAWEGVIGLTEALRLACFESGRLATRDESMRGLRALAVDAQASIDELLRHAGALSTALRSGTTVPPDAAPPLDRLDAAFTRARASGETRAWTSGEVTAMAATVESMRMVGVLLTRTSAMADAAAGHGGSEDHLELPPVAAPPLLPLDRDRLRGAVKGSLAATVSIIVGATLHWTLGTPATATCIVLATTATMGAFVQKSGLRLLGALAGGLMALAALAWVIPIASSAGALVVISALFLFPCAWLLAGSDRINYLGLQAAFAFSIGVLGPLRPTVDLWTPTSRILGVVAGICIFGIVFALLWPTYATRQFRRSMARSLRIVREILVDALAPSEHSPLLSFPRQRRLYESIATTTRLLGEAEYEDPGALDLDRTRGLELLTLLRLLARSVILWRQAHRGVGGAFEAIPSTLALQAAGAALGARIEVLAESLDRGVEPPPDTTTEDAVTRLDESIAQDRAHHRYDPWSTPSVDAFFACVEHARAIQGLLARAHAPSACLRIARRSALAYASQAS